MELAKISARETHFSFEAEAGTALFGGMLYKCINGSAKEELLEFEGFQKDKHFIKILEALNAVYSMDIAELKPTGYIVDTLQCAFWAFINFDNFEEGALVAVNLGGDADTIGAVYGQLAGAFYGYESIPKKWLNKLHMHSDIVKSAEMLASLKSFKLSDTVTRFNEDGNKYTKKAKLKVVNSDITDLKVDIIVNSANSQLFGGSGVCGAIFNAAGYDQMTEACQKIGHCETGEAVITPGFKLPSKWVVHTVGPIYGQNNGQDADLLQSCIWQSLYLGEENRARSIAFPLISTGIYGYPKEEAKKIMINSITEYIEDNPHSSLKKIAICDFSGE